MKVRTFVVFFIEIGVRLSVVVFSIEMKLRPFFVFFYLEIEVSTEI